MVGGEAQEQRGGVSKSPKAALPWLRLTNVLGFAAGTGKRTHIARKGLRPAWESIHHPGVEQVEQMVSLHCKPPSEGRTSTHPKLSDERITTMMVGSCWDELLR